MKKNNPLPSKISILGVRLDALSKKQILERIGSFFRSTRPHLVVTLNSLMILEKEQYPVIQEICEEASLVIPDSSGISWAASYLGYPNVERLPGIDLAFELCKLAEEQSLPIYLLGGGPGVAELAAKHLSSIYPKLLISGMRDGFFKTSDEPAILKDIAASGARLVLVALGMPKQEIWIHQHMKNLPPAVYIGVGGTFDVWSGRIRRAPNWLRSLGLEWAYRLQQEPFRWRRIARLPEFALKVASKREH